MRNDKKLLGQYFTDPTVAMFMAQLVLDSKTKTVLDPAVGPGIFLQCMEKIKINQLEYTAYEIDDNMIDVFKKNNLYDVELCKCDYLTDIKQRKYDAIICNPPYNKFQEIINRKEYISNFKKYYKINMSGYSNLCVYFLIKSLHELEKTGKCAYIMPYEFLNTGYGTVIKKFLLDEKRLKTIFKINNKINLFNDATTTSCIMYFDGSNNREIEFISIDSIDELSNGKYQKCVSHKYEELDPEEKWNKYFFDYKTEYNNLILFRDVAKVSRGIATGNYSYFCLSLNEIIDKGISENAKVRCISKSADIKSEVFTEKDYLELEKENKKVYLFNGCNAETFRDYEYIDYGESVSVNKSFLNSHRTPWFSLEKREPAPIWITVFNRGKLKVVRNETNAKNLTTFHGVYFKDYDEDLINAFFCYLLTPISQEILSNNKREYGNGLDKFEPNDLNDSSVFDVTKLDKYDLSKVLLIYEKIKKDGVGNIELEELNNINSRYVL